MVLSFTQVDFHTGDTARATGRFIVIVGRGLGGTSMGCTPVERIYAIMGSSQAEQK